MATQIAPTPIIKDKTVALKIVDEVNKKPSDKAKIASDKLNKMFGNMSVEL